MENISNTTNLNVRIDTTVKIESNMLFKNLNLKKALKEANYMIKHPEKYKSYDSIEELFEALNSDD